MDRYYQCPENPPNSYASQTYYADPPRFTHVSNASHAAVGASSAPTILVQSPSVDDPTVQSPTATVSHTHAQAVGTSPTVSGSVSLSLQRRPDCLLPTNRLTTLYPKLDDNEVSIEHQQSIPTPHLPLINGQQQSSTWASGSTQTVPEKMLGHSMQTDQDTEFFQQSPSTTADMESLVYIDI